MANDGEQRIIITHMGQKTLPRGFGSIQQEGKGYRAYGNEVQPDGKKKPVRKRFATEKEALAWLEGLNRRNANRLVDEGVAVPETVGDVLRAYLTARHKYHLAHGKPDIQTLNDYATVCKIYFLPLIGDVSLDAVNLKSRLEDLQLHIHKSISEKTGKPLSASRKRNIWLVMRSAFRYATKEGLIQRNPMANIDQFRVESRDPRGKVIPKDDVDKFLDWLAIQGCQHEKHICRLRWELALHSGRRQGEILGLKWDDVLLASEGESLMFVNRKAKSRPWKHGCGRENSEGQYPCGKEQGRYCPKKTGGGIHIEEGTKGGISIKPAIPLDEDIVDMFIAHRKKQQEEAEQAIRYRTMNLLDENHRGMVFTQPLTQRPYGARHDVTVFQRLLREAGIKTHYHIHQLRHTAATELSDSTNGNLPVVASILGHKSIATTLLYVAPDIDARKDAFSAVKDRKAKRKEQREG